MKTRFMKRAGSVFLSLLMAAAIVFCDAAFSEGWAVNAADPQKNGDFGYVTLRDGNIRIVKYYGRSNKIVFPASINGKKVTEIGSGELANRLLYSLMDKDLTENPYFKQDLKIEEIVIPDTVTKINDYAFFQMGAMKSINIPYGVQYIGESAFDHCGSLKKLVIPSSVKEFGEYCFHDTAIPSLYVYTFADMEACGLRGNVNVYGMKGSGAEHFVTSRKEFDQLPSGMKFTYLDVSLNKTTLTLGKGETYKLNATIANYRLTDKSVKWRTSAPKLLSVDKDGNVKALETGIVWATAKASNGAEKSCKIEIKKAPDSVKLSKGILTLGVGEKYSLTSTVNSGSASTKRTYRTSNSSILRMTRTEWQGDFVAEKTGVAYITVRTYNGKEVCCKVTVKEAPSKVTLSRGLLNLKQGQTAELSAAVPENTACSSRIFRTSNSKVVSMIKTSWTGKFKAVGKGTAYVTVRTYNGKEATCKVVVS